MIANHYRTLARHQQQADEYAEQCALLEWAAYQHFEFHRGDGRKLDLCLADCLFSSLNGAALSGTPKQRAAQWARLVKAGAKKSDPDLMLRVPMHGKAGLCIEMKRSQPAFRSESEQRRAIRDGQPEMIAFMRSLGYDAGFAYGWVEAAELICDYMRWPRTRVGV